MANNMNAVIKESIEPPREIPSALADLQSVLATIEADQSELKSRLYPVLDPADTGQDGEESEYCKAAEPRVADIVRSITRRLHSVRQEQRDIISRLHV